MPGSSLVATLSALTLLAGTTSSMAASASAPTAGAERPYVAARSHPVEDPYYPAKSDPRFDALHYDLDLRWLPASRMLEGVATIDFRVTRDTKALRLNLGDPLDVTSAVIDGARQVTTTHPRNALVLRTGPLSRGSRHTLAITYSGTPRPVRAPSTRSDVQKLGWTTTPAGAVWTMQEPFGAFTWYPVNDHPSDKAFYDARIDVPAKWVGIFNGELVNRATRHGRTVTRWHLASPAASYLTTIAIGDYVRLTDTGPHGLPLTYWLPDGEIERVEPLREMPSMLRWLESKLGRFPFDRIGAVVVPSDSAMETQTLLTIGAGAYDRLDFREVILHELAHQWYGDTVTPNNWKDLWLNESFAAYIQVWWGAQHGGPSRSFWVSYWKRHDQRWRDADGPPGAYDRREFADICVYYCGALMLSELRDKVGAASFDASLRRWPQSHRDDNVSRVTYIRWLNQFTGRTLGPWINYWLTSQQSPVD